MPLPYEKVLIETLQNALVHLYLCCEERRGYTPLPRRNEILIKKLKQAKGPEYKLIKKEVVRIIQLGRTGLDMEKCIRDLIDSAMQTDFKVNRLMDLVKVLEDYTDDNGEFFCCFAEEDATTDSNTIKIYRHSIDKAFDNSGKNINPIQIEFLAANEDIANRFVRDFPSQYEVVNFTIVESRVQLSLMLAA